MQVIDLVLSFIDMVLIELPRLILFYILKWYPISLPAIVFIVLLVVRG